MARRSNRRSFIKTGLIFVPSYYAAKAQVVSPGPIMRTIAGGGGGGRVTVSDNFSGTLANWTLDQNVAAIVSGELQLQTGSFGNIYLHYNTPLNTVNQYVKVTFGTGAGGSNRWAYIPFRFTDAASPFYYLEIDCPNFVCQWYHRASVAGASTAIGTSFDAGSISPGVTVGALVTGTGTATEFKVWASPTGNEPDAGSLTWGGAAPTNTKTDDPASPVDTGNLIGLGGVQSTANSLSLDNFFGGDNP